VVRDNQKWMMDELRKLGCKVIYGDSDSCFFTVPGLTKDSPVKEVIKEGKRLAKIVDGTLGKFAEQFGCDPKNNTFKLELDKIDETFFMWGKKKRYVELIMWEGENVMDMPLKSRIKVTGAEAKRSNSSLFTRKTQLKLFELALTQGEEAVREYILQILDDISSGKLRRELGVPMGLKKKADGNAQHMKAARYSNKHLDKDFKKGDKPWIYFVKAVKGKPRTKVVALEWDDDPVDFGLILDAKENLRRHVTLPLANILKAFGLTFTEIMYDCKQQGGDDYWSKVCG